MTEPQNVDSEVYQEMIVKKDIPAILSKFPRRDQKETIFLRQDNASPHNKVTTQVSKQLGIQGIEVSNQTANSPDFNVLDLGRFNSILFNVCRPKG